MHPQAEKLIAELDESRARIKAVLDRFQPGQEIYPGWTRREFIAHVAGWDDGTILAITDFVEGRTPKESPARKGIDFYNAHSVETRVEMDLDHIVREWEFNRRALKDLLAKVPDDKFGVQFQFPWQERGDIHYLVRIMIHHEHEHAEELEKMFPD